jgi:hypothetical protein
MMKRRWTDTCEKFMRGTSRSWGGSGRQAGRDCTTRGIERNQKWDIKSISNTWLKNSCRGAPLCCRDRVALFAIDSYLSISNITN